MKITPQQKREVMAEAQCDPRTLSNWLKKRPMKPTTKARLDAAWKKIKNGRTT